MKFVSQFWRLSGNPGYNATLDRVKSRMLDSGFADGTSPATRQAASVWVEEYPNTGKGWSYSIGTLALAREGETDEPVLTREDQNLSLCINSFSTSAGGVMARLVDVGRGREADFAGKDVTGAVVLGDADPGSRLFQTGDDARRYFGGHLPPLGRYITLIARYACDAARIAGTFPVVRHPHDWCWLSTAFGFKFIGHRLRRTFCRRAIATAPADRPASVRVTIASTFSSGPNRMVVAEIPGRSAPSERVVVTAHVQEPGANDNASGVATLTELARAMRQAIRDGAMAPPERTVTFLWLEEISAATAY